jgi:protein-disulfide isomerase
MSKANREGKEIARQRVAQMKLEQARKARTRRLFTVYGSVVGVIVVVVVVGLLVNVLNKPGAPTVFPANAVADTSGGIASADAMALPIGSSNAPVKMTVYEDFRCSACGEFESTFQTAYKQLVKAGTVELLVHPVNLIDNNDAGTSGSIHAGNAAGCAQDAGKFQAYHDVLYANQPAESTDSFSSNATLINFAKQVPGLDTATFQACVNSGKYNNWILQNYSNLEKIDTAGPSTPTILLNGKPYTLPSSGTAAAEVAQFISDVDKLAGVTPGVTPSASASATASTAPTATTSATPTATKS